MINDIQLDEVLDENSTVYPVINLKPELKLPQCWKFNVPGNDSLMARMVSFQSVGDAVKNVKMGDKFVQLFIMSLSEKGNTGELRGGLGTDAFGAITTIFDTVYDVARQYRFDAVLFRLPIKKMKGQGPAVQRVMARLAQTRTGGKFVVLKELWDFSQKYAYVLIRRKNVQLEDIVGLPPISSDLFTTVKTKAGDTYVCNKTGEAVTKDEAYAASIAASEDSRSSDRQIAAKTKISRRAAISAQYGSHTNTVRWSPEIRDIRDKMNSTPPVVSADNATLNAEVSSIKDFTKDRIKNYTDEDDKFINIDLDELLSMPSLERNDIIGSNNVYMYRTIKTQLSSLHKSPVGNNSNLTPLGEKQLVKTSIGIIQDAKRVMKDFDGRNYLDIYKRLANIHINNYTRTEMNSSQRDRFIQILIRDFTERTTEATANMYKHYQDKLVGDIAEKSNEGKAIKSYCGSGFVDINDFLNGVDEANSYIRDKTIPNLDKAFDYGTRLPKGTPLFRGMRLSNDTLNTVIDKKVFYFTNYVSTSLAPAFAGMYGNTVQALNTNLSDVVDFDADESIENLKSSDSGFNIGFQIKGADKIKVIVPGILSPHITECEVILPRGTAVRINKAYLNTSDTSSRSTAFLESTVIAPEQIDENTEIYDGDALINEGTVKKLNNFSQFLKENYREDPLDEIPSQDESISKSIVEEDPSLLPWLQMIDTDNLPERFVK